MADVVRLPQDLRGRAPLAPVADPPTIPISPDVDTEATEESFARARVRAQLRSHAAVLAFADAPRTYGGAGAVYVLLRR